MAPLFRQETFSALAVAHATGAVQPKLHLSHEDSEVPTGHYSFWFRRDVRFMGAAASIELADASGIEFLEGKMRFGVRGEDPDGYRTYVRRVIDELATPQVVPMARVRVRLTSYGAFQLGEALKASAEASAVARRLRSAGDDPLDFYATPQEDAFVAFICARRVADARTILAGRDADSVMDVETEDSVREALGLSLEDWHGESGRSLVREWRAALAWMATLEVVPFGDGIPLCWAGEEE